MKEFLEADGWFSKKFNRKYLHQLEILLKQLGKARNWDVRLELGLELSLPNDLLNEWRKEQAKSRRKLEKTLDKMRLKKLRTVLKTLADKRYEKLAQELHGSDANNGNSNGKPQPSAYKHLEQILEAKENQIRFKESQAQTMEELHDLRLAIKGWRYLLDEFFGLSSIELRDAQQVLGRLNDLHDLVELLKDIKSREILIALKDEQIDMLNHFDNLRKALPYGLRPYMQEVSISI